MLRYGIPAYRNPPDLLEKEIDQIRALGVRILTGSPVASVEEFRKKYDAVFLGLGTQKARLLPGRRRPPSVRPRRHRLPARRAQRRAGARRAAGRRHRRRERLDRRRPDGPAAGRDARGPDLAREAPRHAGQPRRDRARGRRRRAAPPRLGTAALRGRGRRRLPVLRAGQGRDRQVRSGVRRQPAPGARGRSRHSRHRPGHRPVVPRRQRRREQRAATSSPTRRPR